VQQIAAGKDHLFLYLWQNGQTLLQAINETTGAVEQRPLDLESVEEVGSLIPLDGPGEATQVAVLFGQGDGMAMIDFASGGPLWRLNDGRSTFEGAVWTPHGIACIAVDAGDVGNGYELRLLDAQSGATLDATKRPSLDNWLSWQDGFLLASSTSGLLIYELTGK
jgi:hypothetical protein